MAVIPHKAVIDILNVLPEGRRKVDIVVNRYEHTSYSALRESIHIVCREEVNSFAVSDHFCKLFVAFFPCNVDPFDLSAVFFLKGDKLGRFVLACYIGIDIPV